jgi:exopolyphosphatase / guanosine-5'-triphosphate,3'-diphosphate pyrophosphatase
MIESRMSRYASVDIGSNSVKMQISEVRPGSKPEVLADIRDVTRLGASVFRSGYIDGATQDFVVQILRKMAEAVTKYEVVAIRAVATSAVRDASNGIEFVARASEAIGTKVEIISGQEEARLIYLGVESVWPHKDGRLMVIDVGGGSAEIILGERGRMIDGVSRPLGAVRLTEMFLKSDPPTKGELQQLNHFIDEKLAVVTNRFGEEGVSRVVGTSATAAALVCGVHGIPRSRRADADRLRVTAGQVREFTEELASMNLAARRKVTGIGPRRAEIIVAGASVFARILEKLRLQLLFHSVAGVREGLICDLAARGVGREITQLNAEQHKVVEALAVKFGVSLRHGRRVAGIAHRLFEALQPLHLLPPNDGKLLEAASFLLDAGHYISNVSHHKHSAYIVQNADLPGFTERERLLVAMLCRYHRKAMPAARHDQFQGLPVDAKRTILYLTPIIRIADALPGDLDHEVSAIDCQIASDSVQLSVETDDETLDFWAAEQAAKVFHDVYGRSLILHRKRRSNAA